MSSNRDEQNRSQKIQDDQISARNRPTSSKRAGSKYTQRIEEKKNENQKPLIVEFFNVLPRAWKGLVIGVIVGLIPLIAVIVLRPDWNFIGLMMLVLCAAFGFLIGKATTRKLARGR
jgi:hypothetical protein